MKDRMMLYGVTLRKRYTKRQKAYFLEHIGSVYPRYGFPVSAQEKKHRLFSVCNAVAGDADRAGTVFVASYDTPTRALLPRYKYYPFHAEKSLQEENWNLLARILLAALPAAASFFSFKLYADAQGAARGMYLFFGAAFALLTMSAAKVRPSPVNFNRNSASLAVLEQIAESCRGNRNVAFAFLDQSVASYEGLKLFLKRLKGKPKTIVILDSVSSGGTLLLAHRGGSAAAAAEKIEKAARKNGLAVTDRTYREEKAQKNVLSFSKDMLYLVSGEVEGREFAVNGTRSGKDIRVDIGRMEKIASTLAEFAGNQEPQKQ